MKVIPFTRHHRTALVIDVRSGISSDYEERVKRLLQSVNGPNIKVDVFTLTGPEATLTAGTTLPSASTVAAKAEVVTLSPGSPFSKEAEAAPAVTDEGKIQAELRAALKGYTQLLFVQKL